MHLRSLIPLPIQSLIFAAILMAPTQTNAKEQQQTNGPEKRSEYSVAAYVWPSCHDEKRSREMLWSEGVGEWEIIKRSTPRFEGHYQPRLPLWGYAMDNDPTAWEKKIAAATDHAVNVFIFDWYWYDGQPFLEEALNEGFLKAKNNGSMQFYIMWANHDVPGNMWNPYRYKTNDLLWRGAVGWDDYKILVARIIRQYLGKPNYFKIDNKPVISIYSLNKLIEGFGGYEETAKALDYLRAEVKKAGFPDVHLQGIGNVAGGKPYLVSGKLAEGASIGDVVKRFKIDSVTMYNWYSRNGIQDYLKYAESALELRKKWDANLSVPFFPCISVGWDTTPRYPDRGKDTVIHLNSTPESFAAYLQKTREYVKQHPKQTKLIVINAWNEWVEGSYLEPDMRFGYGYLEAVKKVMSGKYDKYSRE